MKASILLGPGWENDSIEVLWRDAGRVFCRLWRNDDGGEKHAFIRIANAEEHPTLGAEDIPDRLMIPEKLYGRDREIDALLGNSNFRPTPKRTFGTAASIRIGCWEIVERLPQRPQMAVFEVAESSADIVPIVARAFVPVGFLDVSVTNCLFNKLLKAFAAC